MKYVLATLSLVTFGFGCGVQAKDQPPVSPSSGPGCYSMVLSPPQDWRLDGMQTHVNQGVFVLQGAYPGVGGLYRAHITFCEMGFDGAAAEHKFKPKCGEWTELLPP